MRLLYAVFALVVCTVLAGCGSTQAADQWGEAPPDGTRWVGMNGVVVAVPEWWTTGETRCFAPVEDTVYFDEAAVAECPNAPSPSEVREVSALAIFDGSHGYGEWQMRGMRSIGDVAGHEVLESDGCEEWFKGSCRRFFAVPSANVVFAVTIAEEGDGNYAQIRDSLRFLPDTSTTVPLKSAQGWTPTWGEEPPAADAIVQAIEDAGLDVEVVTAKRPDGDSGMVADLPAGSLLEVNPGMGSVIDAGGTVTVTVAGKP